MFRMRAFAFVIHANNLALCDLVVPNKNKSNSQETIKYKIVIGETCHSYQ